MDQETAETPRRRLGISPYLVAFFVGIVCLTLMRPLLRREPAPPPLVARLPEFELTAADGTPFGRDQLAGKVWIADFFFTRCTSICPLLTATMGRIGRRLDEAGIDDVRLLSITVDPEHDTPERLRTYGDEHGIDPRRWTLVTGDAERVRRLVVEGFLQPLGQPETTDAGLIDIAHAGRLALIDGTGGLRGFYSSEPLGLDEIFHRSQHVLKEQRGR